MSPDGRPEAITLDLFGTLVDFELVRDEQPLVADLLEGSQGTADPGQVLSTWIEASLAERGRTPFRTVRASIEQGARVMARRHGLSIDPARWASALETLWATRPLRDDAREAIELLDEAGVPWGIVSNVDEGVLGALLRRTGLAGRAGTVVSSHEARAYKPHPRPFRMALEQLGVPSTSTIHIGDDRSEDRAGAKAAGMACIILDAEASLAEIVGSLLDG